MNRMMVYHTRNATKPSSVRNVQFEDARKKGEVIHSGHFMISSVADDQEDLEDIDHGRDSPVHHEQTRMIQLGYDFTNVPKETKNTYQFGPLSTNQITIDASLARLFRCMSLAYQGGKVVSPKWKNFKGMKLTVKDKIRLNNAIWRTWHIQYVMRKKKGQSLIQFATPMEVDVNSHAKPEAVVMEGKYWKRRIETVVAEYKKWRAFFMEKLRLTDYPGLMWVSDNMNTSPSKEVAEFDKPRVNDDIILNDFSDTLFSSLSQQPFQFPNPREIAMHATNSDMMQPGLLQLQPAVDDYMDFDTFQDFLNPPKKPSVSFSGVTNQASHQSSQDMFETNDLNHFLEPHVVQNTTKTASMPNNQALDYVSNFELQPKQVETPYIQPPPIADPIFSSVNITSSSFYPSNRMQLLQPQQPHHHQHEHSVLQMPATAATVPNSNQPSHIPPPYNPIESVKQYPVNNAITQQPLLKVNTHGNIGFLPSNHNNAPDVVVNRVQQRTYPHSKMGTNPTSNRIIYSQPQTSQQANYFPQNHVLLQQNNAISMAPVNQQIQAHRFSVHGAAVIPNQVNNNPVMNNAVNNAQHHQQTQHQQHHSVANNTVSTSNNAVLLKQLINTNSNVPTTPLNNQRRTSRNQANRLKQVQQAPTPPPAVQKPPPVNITPAPPHPKPAVIPTERRRLVEEMHANMVATAREPWPQAALPTAPSPVKPLPRDVDMEQVSLEPVSPLPHDQDIAQMEASQRQGSFSSEQKRRFNIKLGFTRMQMLLPGGSSQANTKTSKATLMSKAAQHIKVMQAERAKMNEEMRSLKEELDKLQLSISQSQQQLPATGAPMPRFRSEEAKNQFKAWVSQQTRNEWKFYVFGVIIRPLFDSYQKEVSVTSFQEFSRTVFEWLDTQCSLRSLRPSVVQSLQILSTTTPILTNPSQMRQQIQDSVKDKQQQQQQTFEDPRSRHGSSASSS